MNKELLKNYENLFRAISNEYNTRFGEQLSTDPATMQKQLATKFLETKNLETTIKQSNWDTFGTENVELSKVYAHAKTGYEQKVAEESIDKRIFNLQGEFNGAKKIVEEKPIKTAFKETIQAIGEAKKDFAKYDGVLPKGKETELAAKYNRTIKNIADTVTSLTTHLNVESETFANDLYTFNEISSNLRYVGIDIDPEVVKTKAEDYLKAETVHTDGIIECAYDLASMSEGIIRDKTFESVKQAHKHNMQVFDIVDKFGVNTATRREELDKSYEAIARKYQPQSTLIEGTEIKAQQ